MLKKTLLRSGFQLLGLFVLAFFLSTAKVDAAMNTCEEQAAECASHCGTTYNAETFWIWSTCAYLVNNQCVADWVPIIVGTFGSGVEYWECIPNDGGNGICQCKY